MKKRSATRSSVRWLFVACLALLLTGCGSILAPKPDRSRFWVLGSTNATAGATGGSETLGTRQMHIGIGPITLPDYLKDRRVLVRSGENQIEGLPNDYWAEPLESGFPRALVYDVSEKLRTASALLYPWYSSKRVRWAVPIDVLQFESTSSGEGLLVARWRVVESPDGDVAFASESRIVEPPALTPVVTTEQRVAALRRCITRLANEIAAKIDTLSRPATDSAPAKGGGAASRQQAAPPSQEPAAAPERGSQPAPAAAPEPGSQPPAPAAAPPGEGR